MTAAAGGSGTPAARWFKRTPDGSDYAVFEGHGQPAFPATPAELLPEGSSGPCC